MLRRRSTNSAGDTISPFLLANVPLDSWPPDGESDGEVWELFRDARRAITSGRSNDAISLWKQIAAETDIEARNVLQAWTYLRNHGIVPADDVAHLVLGVILEVPVHRGVDVLAAYRDGSARYLNYSGKIAIIDTPTDEIASATRALLTTAQALADRIGPWDRPQLPSLARGDARLLMLTPGGFRFGQGSDAQLRRDPMAAPVFDAGARLLALIVDATRS
jgi:hypothetical protein